MHKILTFLILFSINASSYSLLYVGEVESRYWNDVWNDFYDYPLTIYAGGDPDGSERLIMIKIENSFGEDYKKYFYSFKCTDKQKKENKCYGNGYTINNDFNNLVFILNKSIEWGKIQKENNVERVSKNIQYNGKNISSPFGGGNARFFARGTSQIDLILPAYFDLSDSVDRYYSFEAQEKFLRHISNISKTINRSIEENRKSDELFN